MLPDGQGGEAKAASLGSAGRAGPLGRLGRTGPLVWAFGVRVCHRPLGQETSRPEEAEEAEPGKLLEEQIPSRSLNSIFQHLTSQSQMLSSGTLLLLLLARAVSA